MDNLGNESVTIEEMMDLLAQEPFGIKDQANALLIARYLIEPNEDDYILLDISRSEELSVLKSVFKKFVNDYKLINERSERLLVQALDDVSCFDHSNILSSFASMWTL